MFESARAAWGASAIDRCEMSQAHGPGEASDLLRGGLGGPGLGLDVLDDCAPSADTAFLTHSKNHNSGGALSDPFLVLDQPPKTSIQHARVVLAHASPTHPHIVASAVGEGS